MVVLARFGFGWTIFCLSIGQMSCELIDFLVQVVILFVDLLTLRRVTGNRVLETHLSLYVTTTSKVEKAKIKRLW